MYPDAPKIEELACKNEFKNVLPRAAFLTVK
jgi:hypothetical protein